MSYSAECSRKELPDKLIYDLCLKAYKTLFTFITWLMSNNVKPVNLKIYCSNFKSENEKKWPKNTYIKPA